MARGQRQLQKRRYPQYLHTGAELNLRAVAPNLYVSGWKAPYTLKPPGGTPWAAIINLSSQQELGPPALPSADVDTVYLGWYFPDGDGFPTGLLDTIEGIVRGNIKKGPVLIHCAAGLSRSASAAYAMLRKLWGLSDAQARTAVRATPERDPDGRWPVPKTLASAQAWVYAGEQN